MRNFAKIFAVEMNTVTYNGLTFKPFIHASEIAERISTIANQINTEFAGQEPIMICVLNGAFPFAADLFRQLTVNARIAFVRLSSYVGTASSGEIKEVIGLSEPIDGRPVIVIEDIVDTGQTMHKFMADLRLLNPSSLKLATLLFKPSSLKVPVTPDYVGFNIGPEFIIGYGLDIDGLARNLPDIYVKI